MKNDRHDAIIKLIHDEKIGTQEQLTSMLNAQGFAVTQATVSRDIKVLGLIKKSKRGEKGFYVFPGKNGDSVMEAKYERILKEGFVSIDMAQNILVIKTVAGMAMAVCAAIDSMHWREVVGSIAGDDTIMCAVRTVKDTELLMKRIKAIVKV